MVTLMQLWLPIVASAFIVFVASSIIWMALPIHKHDYKNPGDAEGPLLEFMRSRGLAPGVYYVPWCHGAKGNDPAMKEKLAKGPWGQLIVMPGAPNMGKLLGIWMLHLLVISLLVAYVAAHAGLTPGAPYLSVFRVVAVVTLLAHAGYAIPLCNWHGLPWAQLPGRIFDGVIYAGLTAGTFAWLWPALPHAA
jgi:hypothetical protein